MKLLWCVSVSAKKVVPGSQEVLTYGHKADCCITREGTKEKSEEAAKNWAKSQAPTWFPRKAGWDHNSFDYDVVMVDADLYTINEAGDNTKDELKQLITEWWTANQQAHTQAPAWRLRPEFRLPLMLGALKQSGVAQNLPGLNKDPGLLESWSREICQALLDPESEREETSAGK